MNDNFDRRGLILKQYRRRNSISIRKHVFVQLDKFRSCVVTALVAIVKITYL